MSSRSPLTDLIARSQRLGRDHNLVIFGGGNTSAKGKATDPLGQQHDVLWVKGSGVDMGAAEESDFPALKLGELLSLGEFSSLSDDEMIHLVSCALIDPTSKRPSIETLLHAFLPFTHVDHVHADAICALTNHVDGRRVTLEALGDRFAYLDWIRPGFELSRIVRDLPDSDGVVLAHHGLITWGSTSDECYARTMAAVAQAERFIDGERLRVTANGIDPHGPHADLTDEEVRTIVMQFRGATNRTGRRVVYVDRRMRAIADHPALQQIVNGGTSSADHMLRIKPFSLAVTDELPISAKVEEYEQDYLSYVHRWVDPSEKQLRPHDPMPRVALIPGLGGLTTGQTISDAQMAAEIALHTHGVAHTVLEVFGTPQPLPEEEIFGFDYWPMELYKLSLRPSPGPFVGFVCVVTGAASGIGREIATHLGAQGCSLILADVDSLGLERTAATIEEYGGPKPVCVLGDQSDQDVVRNSVNCAIDSFGGLDGVVMNAGIAVPGELQTLSSEDWERTLRVNLSSAFLLTREALKALRIQGCGGSLVYISSKNALGPGAGFGAYSVSKAGMLQLMRIAALEGGPDGIRSNAVNPDAIFQGSRLWDDGIREERAAAHGVAAEQLEEFYASRNLLSVTVSGVHVAESVAFLLSDKASRTTGCLVSVDGGVATAFPR